VTPEQALAALTEVGEAMRTTFPDHPDRLGQLDAALATAAMAVTHLVDEELRHKHDERAHARATGAW